MKNKDERLSAAAPSTDTIDSPQADSGKALRKRAEKALRLSEKNFRRSLDDSPLGVRIVTIEGETLYANRAILDIYGYDSVEELRTTPLKNRYTPESFAGYQIRREKRKRGVDRPSEYEISIVRKNGEIRHLQVFRKNVLWDGERQFQVIYQDITERKRAEAALKESEGHYRSLFDGGLDGICLADAKTGIIVDCNQAMAALVRRERAELIGQPQTILHPPQNDKTALSPTFKQHLADKEGQILETQIVTKTGEMREVEIKANLLDIHGRKLLQGLFRDITERKRAEEALRESEERFRRLSAAAFEAIIIHEGGFLLSANDQYYEMFGYEPEELLGKQALPLTAAPEAIESIRKKIATGGLGPYESIGLKKDGTKLPMEIRVREMEYKGRKVRMAALRDITERKQAEIQLHASLREKEILIREVHHRVKNNMQVISGLLDLQASSCGNPELMEMFRESQSRIRSMALVHEKLYASKDLARIDLAGYARTLLNELLQSYKINPGKIDLIIRTDDTVCVDINKAIPCGLILNELISNTLKHAFPGDGSGELRVIIHETKNTEIEIIVRDNGIVLPDDVDIHQPRSVGLYLVNGLVKNQLDGQIEVRRDNGTEFCIKFPL